jgi:hypothetical protein
VSLDKEFSNARKFRAVTAQRFGQEHDITVLTVAIAKN